VGGPTTRASCADLPQYRPWVRNNSKTIDWLGLWVRGCMCAGRYYMTQLNWLVMDRISWYRIAFVVEATPIERHVTSGCGVIAISCRTVNCRWLSDDWWRSMVLVALCVCVRLSVCLCLCLCQRVVSTYDNRPTRESLGHRASSSACDCHRRGRRHALTSCIL